MSWSAFSSYLLPNTPDALHRYSQIGDYVGGVFGTFVAAVSLLLVIVTLRYSQKSDHRSKVFSIVSEMLKTHEDIISSLCFMGAQGRDVFAEILSEFDAIYHIVKAVSERKGLGWSLNERINVAYIFTFYGPILTAAAELSSHPPEAIKEVNDLLTIKRGEERERRIDSERFSGHQGHLSHYFRNLYSLYMFIDQSRLSRREKDSLGKVVRSKMTNHEQAVLAINILSQLGRPWETGGLVARYGVFKNIPEAFYAFDRKTPFKELFPYLSFEYEERGGVRARTATIGFLGFRLYIQRTS